MDSFTQAIIIVLIISNIILWYEQIKMQTVFTKVIQTFLKQLENAIKGGDTNGRMDG